LRLLGSILFGFGEALDFVEFDTDGFFDEFCSAFVTSES